MRLRLASIAVLSLGILPAPTTQAAARDLTFEERVKAQEAIDHVYYSHQIGATKPFEEAVPRSVLEQKVRTYLKESLALEKFWHTPITADGLQKEMERMARQTRMPDRLRELFGALGDDPLLIQETLVRPALVGRLARNMFAYDRTIHAEARRHAEKLHDALAAGAMDPFVARADRAVVRLARSDPAVRHERSEGAISPEDRRRRSQRLELSPEDFDRWLTAIPAAVGEPADLLEMPDGFTIQVALTRRAGEIDLATYFVAKKTWEEWWSGMEAGFDAAPVATVAGSEAPLPSINGRGGNGFMESSTSAGATGTECVDDEWALMSVGRAPEARRSLTAVWTGSLMIVWGGYDSALDRVNTGGRYDPATDTWTPTSTVNAPTPRSTQVSIWTGGLMVVWSGENRIGLNTGGRYDPLTDTWTPTSIVNAPAPRSSAVAVWTGSLMLVWGGANNAGIDGTGGRYDPASDSWAPISTTNAPPARYGHTAVWTGGSMVVWGGTGSTGTVLSSGGAYNPANDTWAPMIGGAAPAARSRHTAVWTGREMIVWGGTDGSLMLDSGGRYDPATSTWSPMSMLGAPMARQAHTAIWTGSEMIVWGGAYFSSPLASGGRYDPATNRWTGTSSANAPSGRLGHTAVWTGTLMVVWGGNPCGGGVCASFDTGGRYDPADDAWTPTYTGNVPYPRNAHTAVWTGSLMVIWGGHFGGGLAIVPLDTGGRYDPAIDTWTPTSTMGAPPGRGEHTAVWTGSNMIVWGGYTGSADLNTGGRYDPLTDAWKPTSTTGSPSARSSHTAAWTGSLMVVWGGFDVTSQNTGARYDPATDTWTPTGITGAPSPRGGHSAVWTGSRMVIWGGRNDSTGGLYDPSSDTWTPTAITGAPSPRGGHSAVWTGKEMIVWGGGFNLSYFGDGGRYDPAANVWSALSQVNAPVARAWHSAVWTASEMIIWGGMNASSYFDSGGRYDPMTDSWTSTSTTNAPSGRVGDSAVWTGSRMLVWGGGAGFATSTGSAYCGCLPRLFFRDADADGFGDSGNSVLACAAPAGYVDNSGDCNDAAPNEWGTPSEVHGDQFADVATMVWSAPSSPGATTIFYDVLRSTIPTDFVQAATCVATGSADTSATDPATPPLGGLFFYLVRADDACPSGLGSLGTTSSGTARAGRTCP